MRTLVIETATAACSAALLEDGRVVDARHEVVGRGHAERLVPMIGELDRQGRADRVLVDVGPGSFTGVRVGLAAARGLGIGWGSEVAGFSSLALVAAAAFAGDAALRAVAVVLEGGHGEVFVQSFGAERCSPLGDLASLRPEDAARRLGDVDLVVGSGAARLAAIGIAVPCSDALPDARAAIHLPPELSRLPARPIYGRAPDAKPKAA